MLPSVLLAAVFALPVEVTITLPGRFVPVRWHSAGIGSAVPWQYAIHVWDDPAYLRTYPWNYGTPSVWKGGQFQPSSSVTTAEQIKRIEKVIELLKSLGSPAADIEGLLQELDELKAKSKKSK